MVVLNFIINEIFGQGAIFLALVAMIGLILQKKSASEVIRGTIMTAIGFFVLNAGTGLITGSSIDGISAAFLGGLNPIGTIFASYFIQHITDGGSYLDKAIYPSQISDLISAIIIYLCGFVLFFKYVMNSRIRAKEEKKLREEKKSEGGQA